uniref:Right handed beta helix domain-containing protein n=1 Tax=Panagrolaimus davidi TaxID=227884 RepID=A0A914QNN1_9BILA
MNGINIHRSARDGIYFYQPTGPILIANSSITYNRGHGIAIDNTTDGRVFINMTVVQGNYGDGIWYKQRQSGINLYKSIGNLRDKRQSSSYYEEEQPRIDMCLEHGISNNLFFPHLIKLYLRAGTPIDPILPPICWMVSFYF